jgi:hypothetical protein
MKAYRALSPPSYPLPFTTHRNKSAGSGSQYIGVFAKFQHVQLSLTRLNLANERIPRADARALCDGALSGLGDQRVEKTSPVAPRIADFGSPVAFIDHTKLLLLR